MAKTLRIKTVRNIGWGFTDEDLENQLNGFSGGKIIVPINSFGGDVFTGFAAYNMLIARKERVNTRIMSIALSMGSILSASGNPGYVDMPENGYYMIHNPKGANWGEAKHFEGFADLLRQMTDNLANVYVRRTAAAGKPLSKDKILEMMDKETWLNGERAYELGFVDNLTDGVKLEASADFNFIRENYHPPSNLFTKVYPMSLSKIKNQVTALADMLGDFMEEDPSDKGKATNEGNEEKKPGANADGNENYVTQEELSEIVNSLVQANEKMLEAVKAVKASNEALAEENKGLKEANASLKRMVNKSGKDADGKNKGKVNNTAENFLRKVNKGLKVSNETEF